jgi:hemerythrin-like metal-binding protein
MKLMTWSVHFETGIQSVDAQHHGLVDLINAVAQSLALEGESAKQQVMPLLQKLIEYAALHFKHEDDLMLQFALTPSYTAHHRQTHQAFVDEVLLMRQQFESGDCISGSDLLRFLTSWLTFHILSEDKRLAAQVHAIESGQSPAQAYANVNTLESAAPSAVYTTALLDLFSLLTERNRSLEQVNAQVRAAQLELEAVNRTLETRVQQRTQDLQASNHALESERQALLASMTQLERTQAQLLQSEKMAAVGQLAAGVAHEINNPIGFVNSNLGSLSHYLGQLFEVIDACQLHASDMQPALCQTIQGALQKIDYAYLRQDIGDLLKECKEGLARVKIIVSDLRDFSHVDEGKWLVADLNQAIESALNVVTNEIKYKADIHKELSELPKVLCIVSQINQVLVNLLVNAAHSIAVKGSITVRTGVAGDMVWVEITDTGCGMSEEVQKRIFEPFYTTKPVGQGTGLGLSISWEIVKRHQGKIELQSQVGKGSTFRITLPQNPQA